MEIKNRFDGKIIVCGEYDSIKECLEKNKTANLSGANLYGANLYRANLYRADLYGADLSLADLSGADLSLADLSGANLYRADLSRANLYRANLYGEKINEIPIQICGLRWWINITKKHIQIGCEVHKAEEWFKFKDSRIKLMDEDALDWWKENKKFIKSAWKHHCKES